VQASYKMMISYMDMMINTLPNIFIMVMMLALKIDDTTQMVIKKRLDTIQGQYKLISILSFKNGIF